jgi:hypothetical protein
MKHVVNCLGALSRLADSGVSAAAAMRLSQRLVDDHSLLAQMNGEAITACLTALTRWHAHAACHDAAVCMAKRLVKDDTLLDGLSEQQLAQCFEALSPWKDGRFFNEASGLLRLRIPDRVTADAE